MTGSSNSLNLIKSLIEKTNSNQINWKNIHNLRNIKNLEEVNPNAYYLIFENEWHHIFSDSYYADVHVGNVYLLHEEFESGRDGSVVNLYNLYIQERDDNDYLFATEPTLISDKKYDLDELINAIKKSINKKEAIIKKFVNKFNDYFQ